MALTNTAPNPTIAARATVKIGSTTLQCVSTPANVSDTCEPIKVVTTSGAYEISVPGAITKTETMDVKVLKDANALPVAGTITTLTITISECVNGSETAVDSVVEIPCVVTAVKPDSIEADGNRLEAVTLTLQPTNIGRDASAE